VKNILPWLSLLTLAFSFAAQTSFAANNVCAPKPDLSNVNCPDCAAKAAANGSSSVDQLMTDVNAVSCEPWAVTRTFDPVNQCPKLFFDQIFKDRIGYLGYFSVPKKACSVEASPLLPDAESLEAVLASNPVTSLGLPAGSITNPKCLYKDYRGTNLDTIFGRLYPKGTATEQERMTGLAEYYYHMNKIKYAEQGLLAQMAGIDSILGGPILPDKNCADPNNPFSAKWCDAYHATSCQGSGQLPALTTALKKKYDQAAQIDEEISKIVSPSQPEQKEQIQAKKKEIASIVGGDVIIRSPKFMEVAKQTHGDITAALRAELQENRADLARQLANFQEASRCINSAKSVSCPTLESTVNKVSDDFLPDMTTKGGDAAKTSLAQTYMDKISCYQGVRGNKTAHYKFEERAALTVGSFAIGAGEAAAVDTVAVNGIRAAEVAWGLASAAPIGADTFKACVEASHRLNKSVASQEDPYQLPSCSKGSDATGLFAVHNYTTCYLGIGETAATALMPAFASTKLGGKVLNVGKAAASQGAGLVKQVFIYSVGSSLINSFFGVGFNIVNQQSSKIGTQLLASPATVLSNFVSKPDSQNKRSTKHALSQLNTDLDPSKFAGLSPDEANKLFQSTANKSYQILLNSQQVLRGDQLSGVGLKWNQRINPLGYYANIEISDTHYMAARADLEALEKVSAPSADQKERMTQDKAKMKFAETVIARNIAGKMLYDFMTPQYRTDNAQLDPKLSTGLDVIAQANAMGYLSDLVRTDIQELLAMDGWSPKQVQDVINAQLNGQTAGAEF
jgi:hypothetical protein